MRYPALFATTAAPLLFAALCGIASAARIAPSSAAQLLQEPASPASIYDIPYSRTRPAFDADRGVADPRAVAAFRAARLQLLSPGLESGPRFTEHAGQGFYEVGTPTTTFGAYANHALYIAQREPGNPSGGSGGFLYAPTMFGPGADCIEATTVVQNSFPQIWAWDWCAANPNPYAVVVANKKFSKNYIRTMKDGLPEFTVETILAADGVTWDMLLYNYTTAHWDMIYQTSGARNGNYGLGQQGWDFFETYTSVAGSVSDVCNAFPGPIAADRISLSLKADGKHFVLLRASDSRPLQFGNFYCTHFAFSVPHVNWEWEMSFQ